MEEASPTIPHITDPRSQSPRIPPADAGCWMPDPRCRIPESHSEAWLAGWLSHPIAWLNRSWGRVWGGVGALKQGTFLKPIVGARPVSGTRYRRLPPLTVSVSQRAVETLLLPRCPIPEAHSEAWLAGCLSLPIAWLNRSWGRVWGGVGALKKGTFLKRLAHTTERFWDSLPALPALAALPDRSPGARFKPYFSRACPQDEVSSTRQTPSN